MMLNNHQIGKKKYGHSYGQQRLHFEHEDEDPPPSYHTYSMANKNTGNHDHDNGDNNNGENNIDDQYQMSMAQENVLQRQFNLYRYYLSQYPELFQEYFRIQQQQHHQIGQQPVELYLIDNEDDDQLQYQSKLNDDGGGGGGGGDGGGGTQELYQNCYQTKKTNHKRLLVCRCSKCCQSDSSICWSEQSSSSAPVVVASAESLASSRIQSDRAGSAVQQQHQPHRPNAQHATSNALYYLDANHLLEDERYEHLSRVITPPNAFLNIHQQPANNKKLADDENQIFDNSSLIMDDTNIHYDTSTGKLVFYSDKRTQTDTIELKRNGGNQPQQPQQPQQQQPPTYQKVDKLAKNLQRQLALISTRRAQAEIGEEEEQETTSKQEKNNIVNDCTENSSFNNKHRSSFESTSEHIYHTIKDKSISDQFSDPIYIGGKNSSSKHNNANKSFWWNKSDRPPKLTSEQNSLKKLSEQHLKNQIKALKEQAMARSEQNLNSTAEQAEHRIPTSNNGIPCACERCRESRGMNLTTELLPIDTQIPLQTMDNMDSFFQDSSMAELVCRII